MPKKTLACRGKGTTHSQKSWAQLAIIECANEYCKHSDVTKANTFLPQSPIYFYDAQEKSVFIQSFNEVFIFSTALLMRKM